MTATSVKAIMEGALLGSGTRAVGGEVDDGSTVPLGVDDGVSTTGDEGGDDGDEEGTTTLGGDEGVTEGDGMTEGVSEGC